MNQVKLLADVVDVARRAPDRWYVTTGNTAVGPVKLDLIARGVEAGKVPIQAFVRHEAWKVWRPLRELAEIVEDEPQRVSTDDIAAMARPSTSDDFLPGDAIEGAGDRREALMLLMNAAVVRGAASAAVVHEVDGDGVVVACAYGTRVFEVMGVRTSLLDPAVVAAASGATVVAEPAPGPAGRAIVARLSAIVGPPPIEGAIMIPVLVRGRLSCMIELGRVTPFRAAEIASLEALVHALAVKLEGWD